MKQRHDFLHILATLACAFCFAACTPEDIIDIFTDDDQETPATPSDPTDDKNTVTVTSNGALVTHGDISINFPKGTFTNDSKVTVTEEKKGAHGGKYEASTFDWNCQYNAYSIDFNSGSATWGVGYNRSYGFTVRPVQ